MCAQFGCMGGSLAYLGVCGCGRLRTLGEWVSVYARFAVCDDLFGPLAPCWCVVSSLDHPWTVLRSCRWCLSAGGPYEVGVLLSSQSAGFLGAVFDGQ